MLGKKAHNSDIRSVGSSTALLSEQTEIRGDISFHGSMHIEGRVQGDVLSDDGELTLAETAVIEGNIRVPCVIINGHVQGDVSASEKLEVAGMAVITGTVRYLLIEIEVGAQINGSLECLGETVDASRTLEPPMLEKEIPAGAIKSQPA